MYNPIIPSISYGPNLGIGLEFDVQSFMDMVALNVIAVNRTLIYFSRSKQRSDKNGKVIALKMSKEELVEKIGVHVEIIQHAIFLSMQEQEDIKINADLKKNIKKLFSKLSTLIFKLGQHDSDFGSISITKRATPNDDIMTYLEKKW